MSDRIPFTGRKAGFLVKNMHSQLLCGDSLRPEYDSPHLAYDSLHLAADSPRNAGIAMLS